MIKFFVIFQMGFSTQACFFKLSKGVKRRSCQMKKKYTQDARLERNLNWTILVLAKNGEKIRCIRTVRLEPAKKYIYIF